MKSNSQLLFQMKIDEIEIIDDKAKGVKKIIEYQRTERERSNLEQQTNVEKIWNEVHCWNASHFNLMDEYSVEEHGRLYHGGKKKSLFNIHQRLNP